MKKCWFWNHKRPTSSTLGTRRMFFKYPNYQFYPIFNVCHEVQFQKNLKNRFRENLENAGPKNRPFTPFWPKQRFFSKKVPSLFSHYWTLTLCKKSEKSNEPMLGKQHYRLLDGWMELNSKDPPVWSLQLLLIPTRLFNILNFIKLLFS